MRPTTLIAIGAGNRGSVYSSFASAEPERATVVAVADPRSFHRNRIGEEHGLPSESVCAEWEALAARPRFADAVVIATPDSLHAEQAISFAAQGYHILLEKPMATTYEDCVRIVGAVRRAGVMLAVCHVMRYTTYTRKVKQILDAGLVGEVVSIQHLEPVGYWHQAHSYVRGNWRREVDTGPMILTKSCHDLDWLRYIIGDECVRVSSFGSLSHFRRESKPPEAGDAMFCVDCEFEPQCPYSATKIYVERIEHGIVGWPVNVVAPTATRSALDEALRTGPYGRCVYECDNDVVDHQVVSLEFARGATANFTMTAFSPVRDRKTRIFGTRGMIEGDGRLITHTDFLSDSENVVDVEADSGGVRSMAGHAGGDWGIMDSFVRAVATEDETHVLSGPAEALESHTLAFAAERARREGRVIEVEVFEEAAEGRAART